MKTALKNLGLELLTALKDALLGLLGSKKFLVTLAGVVVAIGNKALHIDLPDEEVLKVLAFLASYVVGQGIADHGKHAAAIHSETAKALTSPSTDSAADPS